MVPADPKSPQHPGQKLVGHSEVGPGSRVPMEDLVSHTWADEPEGGYTAYPAGTAPKAFCRRDWGMHSCILQRFHEEDHVCICGWKEKQ